MNPFYHFGVEKILQKQRNTVFKEQLFLTFHMKWHKLFEPIFAKYNKANISFVAPTDSGKELKL